MDSMQRRITWRPIVASLVLLVTIVVFVNYFVTHPEVKQELTQISLALVGLLLILYFAFVGSLALVNSAALRLCQKSISGAESLLLTMYSSVINFFGPLQSGPAFRAAYLKKKHGVKIKDYTLASLVYYFFYGLFSGLLLLSGVLHWWALVILGGVLIGLLSFRHSLGSLNLKHWPYMAGATLLQISLLVVIFYIELYSVAPDIKLEQVLIYTGAANLALFVSITPAAIGFRESFLLLSQNLHHIETSTIVAASTIDRAVYVVLLVILAIGIFSTHAHRYLKRATQT